MNGGCPLHGVPGIEWPAWYRCSVCGCGGSAHGLYRAPGDLHTGPIAASEAMYCWAHRPVQQGLGL